MQWVRQDANGNDQLIWLTEFEPGIIHITTEALTQLLGFAGFTPDQSKETR